MEEKAKKPRARVTRIKLNLEATYKKKYNLLRPPLDVYEQNVLADQMVDWAYDSDSVSLAEFPISKTINPYRFYKVAEKNEYFADALQHTKYILGERLKKKWIRGELEREYVLKFLGQYDPEYKAEYMEKVESFRKLQLQSNQGAIQVVMEPFPSSPLVPVKKETHE